MVQPLSALSVDLKPRCVLSRQITPGAQTQSRLSEFRTTNLDRPHCPVPARPDWEGLVVPVDEVHGNGK